jgi:hypothetical protein
MAMFKYPWLAKADEAISIAPAGIGIASEARKVIMNNAQYL